MAKREYTQNIIEQMTSCNVRRAFICFRSGIQRHKELTQVMNIMQLSKQLQQKKYIFSNWIETAF
jgi:hypothetical protein